MLFLMALLEGLADVLALDLNSNRPCNTKSYSLTHAQTVPGMTELMIYVLRVQSFRHKTKLINTSHGLFYILR